MEEGTAFRRCSRRDLNWVFTVQTERVVAKDNTVAIGPRSWQLNKSRFRHTLAGSMVTIHEHLDGGVSMRYGPHVVGEFSVDGTATQTPDPKRRGKGVSSASHPRLEISPKARDSHFPTAPTTTAFVLTKTKAKAKLKTKAEAA